MPTTDWYHLIANAHNNSYAANQYEFHIATSFWDKTNFYMRSISPGAVGAWRTLLNNANYNSYSPSLTGSGASGTWGINVTGNAATITSQANSATTTASTAANGNQIVLRDGSGHITGVYGFFNYLNMSHGASGSTTDSVFYSSGDDYIRKNNATGFRASLNVPTRTGGDASGTWGINITGSSASCSGNAATVTNGLYTSGGTVNAKLTCRVSGVSLGSGNSSQLEINNAGSGACNISFHREGAYGAHFG
jgi:hypothetical protein